MRSRIPRPFYEPSRRRALKFEEARFVWRYRVPPGERRLVYISVLMASALAAAGIVGDGRGWWDGKAYLVNLLSSLTAFIAGVPLALVLFRRVKPGLKGEEQARNSQLTRVGELVIALLRAGDPDTEVQIPATDLYPGVIGDGLYAARRLRSVRRLWKALTSDDMSAPLTPENLRDLRPYLQAALQELAHHVRDPKENWYEIARRYTDNPAL